jgi:hypothetical protein
MQFRELLSLQLSIARLDNGDVRSIKIAWKQYGGFSVANWLPKCPTNIVKKKMEAFTAIPGVRGKKLAE